MTPQEWLLLLVSLLIFIAGVAILLGFLGFVFKIFYRLWWLPLIAIGVFLAVAQGLW
jgi:hypothetical protein